MERIKRKQIRLEAGVTFLEYQKFREKAREKGNLREEAEALNIIGGLHSEIEEYDEALSCHREELQLCVALSDKIGEAVAHRKVGECYALLFNFTKALKHQNQHLELARAVNSLPEQQRAHATIGRTYLMQGEDFHSQENFEDAKPSLLKAEKSFRSAIQLSQQIQESKILSEKEVFLMKTGGISNLAYVYHFLSVNEEEGTNGNYSRQSLELYRKALALSEKRMLPDETHRIHLQLTMYFRNRDRVDYAIQHAEKAFRCAKVARDIGRQVEALVELGSSTILSLKLQTVWVTFLTRERMWRSHIYPSSERFKRVLLRRWRHAFEIVEVIEAIQFWCGDCDGARKAFKKCYRLSQDSEAKSTYREKLRPVMKILYLQRQVEELSRAEERFKLYERIADKFSDYECYEAAFKIYKKQEEMIPQLPNLPKSQRAAVYYSLALTCSDLKKHDAAIEYFHKEKEHYSDPKELAKTWTQIGKVSRSLQEAEECHKKAVGYAEKTDDPKLKLTALDWLLGIQEKLNSDEVTVTRQKLTDLQIGSGIISPDDENSEDPDEGQSAQEESQDDDDEIDALVEQELETNDGSDVEESRKSRMNQMHWRKKLNGKGETALHRACIEGQIKQVQLLIEQKHPLNMPDNCGWTPLHEACNHGFTEIVRLLVEKGADIDKKAECGTTPMQDAALNGHLYIVQTLLDQGANVTLKNRKGDTVLSNMEHYYARKGNVMDSFDKELFWRLHRRLIAASDRFSGEKENTDPCSSSTFDGLFDPDICTQQITVGPTIPPWTQDRQEFVETHDFDSDFPPESIFDDNLPSSSKGLKISKRDHDEEVSSAADDYKSAIARLGGADALSKISDNSKKILRAPKRSLRHGLINEDDYVGDDWLIEDVEEISTARYSGTQQPKRIKTGIQDKSQTCRTQLVKTKTKSGTFSSPFLNQGGIRVRNSSPKSISTSMRDFLPDNDDKIIIDDEIIDNNIANMRENHRRGVTGSHKRPLVVETPPQTIMMAPQSTSLRIKVRINGKAYAVGVPGRMKSIGWLCERASQIYKQDTGLSANITLYAGGNDEDAYLLSKDDIVAEVLQNDELIIGKIESWKVISLAQQYEESCATIKQVPHPAILAACHQSASTGTVDLRNHGITSDHIEPLLKSLAQQKISSMQFSGNNLRDGGIHVLCEALDKHATLNDLMFSGSVITELNLRCTNLTKTGLKTMAQITLSGSLRNLQTLDVSYNRLDDSCSRELSSILNSCVSLQSLSIARCRFTDQLLQADYLLFKEAMQGRTTLSYLDVSHNLLGSIGCELLLKSLPHRSVTQLNFTGICDASDPLVKRHISYYLKKEDCALQTLRFGKNHLTEAKIKIFVSEIGQIKTSSFRTLDFSSNCHPNLKFTLEDF